MVFRVYPAEWATTSLPAERGGRGGGGEECSYETHSTLPTGVSFKTYPFHLGEVVFGPPFPLSLTSYLILLFPSLHPEISPPPPTSIKTSDPDDDERLRH